VSLISIMPRSGVALSVAISCRQGTSVTMVSSQTTLEQAAAICSSGKESRASLGGYLCGRMQAADMADIGLKIIGGTRKRRASLEGRYPHRVVRVTCSRQGPSPIKLMTTADPSAVRSCDARA
jgi:hypothetical protein